ncbi:putative glutathione S-transferase GSTU6 [Hordeum vulgare]|uniref:Glutathione S-transferase n=1 Tax=Hordeum vulgare subsp. vulgare TaxID=112509 RepID=A0A8I6XCH9_HORVV|nr:probable glutathione S-transferase GSTU6 [Hordeum vulgare subsp. vulgare]KAE8779895.1 putative glutathione S-transferase GSTU6 [Hordeum vulgare]
MEEEEELTLVGYWSSPFALRARYALNLKGLPYAYVEEVGLFDSKSPLLLASNPVHKRVPVLIHNGKPVPESQLIVQYVDEAFPASSPRFLPSDPHERAVARFWASYVDGELLSAWLPVYGGRTGEERAQAAGRVGAALETLERAFGECSKGKGFFGGDTVGLVDVVLGGFVGWLKTSEAMCGVRLLDAAATPLLAAWAERFRALHGVKEVMPDPQRLLEYNLMRRARLGLPLTTPPPPPQQ